MGRCSDETSQCVVLNCQANRSGRLRLARLRGDSSFDPRVVVNWSKCHCDPKGLGDGLDCAVQHLAKRPSARVSTRALTLLGLDKQCGTVWYLSARCLCRNAGDHSSRHGLCSVCVGPSPHTAGGLWAASRCIDRRGLRASAHAYAGTRRGIPWERARPESASG